MNIIEQYDPLYFNRDPVTSSHKWVLEINSLNMENKSQYCRLHRCCVKHVSIGDILFLMKFPESSVGVSRLVVGAFKVDETNGFATCLIGYLPRRYYDHYTIEVFDGLYLSVVFDDRPHDRINAVCGDSILAQIVPSQDISTSLFNKMNNKE
jgi:hypothetical protein